MANTNPRQYHTQQTHYLRKTVNSNDAGIASGVLMGTVPSGADHRHRCERKAAFSMGTTNGW